MRTTDWTCLVALATGLMAVGCSDDQTQVMSAVGSTGVAGAQTSGAAGGGAAPHVTVEDGELAGQTVGTVSQFLGIPYAKPPVGALRWRRPQKNDKWTGVRDATKFGPRCAQNASAVLQNMASADEDCLYVNVWTPSITPAAPVPVMFWIHGGGNQNGSANEPVPYAGSGLFYSGQFLAQNQGVVVVTLNYRLGAFGFFTNAALDQEEGGNSGNQGLWDQTRALQWVQANIAKFGGDPKNVTIFGESAGSLDVCLHVASPKSAGLFTKAISQSGGCTTKNTLKAVAAGQNDMFAAALGCSGPSALECLRAKPVADILTQAAATTTRFGQVVEGEFLPKQPRELFDSGAVNKVPYILGSNTDEGTLFTLSTPVTTEAELKAALAKSLPGADIATIMSVYPLSRFADQKNPAQAALARILGDAQLVCSTWDAAARMSKLGGNVWMYNFDVPVVIATMPDLGLGASHGAELVYVFQTSPAFAAENTALSNVMQTYWATFAKTGDPNGGSQLAWPKFSEDASTRINFALTPTIVAAFRKAECTFWRQGYDLQFTPPATTTMATP